MSQISLKSISGITSITTPAGVDDVFSIHKNDTTEVFRIDQSGNQNITGIITASQFKGDGSELTGVSGFSTALSNDTTSLLNQIFKTSVQHNVAAGTSVTIQSDAGSGNVAFTRLDRINVATGATIHVAAGTTFIMNVLNVFS